MTSKHIATWAYKKSAKIFFINNHFIYRISLIASLVVGATYLLVAEKPSSRIDYTEMMRDEEVIKQNCLRVQGMSLQHLEGIRKNCFMATRGFSSKFEECRSRITDLELGQGIYAKCKKSAYVKAHTNQSAKNFFKHFIYYLNSILLVIVVIIVMNHIFPSVTKLCVSILGWINAGRFKK